MDGDGEGAFDLVITGGKLNPVRFWVGTENADGSVKAKAAGARRALQQEVVEALTIPGVPAWRQR